MRRCYRLIAVRSASGVLSLEEVQAILAYQTTAQCKMMVCELQYHGPAR